MKIKIIDGNEAAAYISYACSEVATIYPITPSSRMPEMCEKWSVEHKKNIFGYPMTIKQMQSEAGAAGALHGALLGGALSTTFTASQGLLLMIPNMYKIAGELLPTVIHVTARSLATHALSIFGDHSDINAVRQTNFCMIASSNPQEVMDMALVAHSATIKSSIPFLHFFDGFITSHLINVVENINYESIKKMFSYKKISKFKGRRLSPSFPSIRGTAQNPDIFFQNKEAANKMYNELGSHIKETFNQLYIETGRKYDFFDYCGSRDAEHIIVSMGSSCDTIEETVNHLTAAGEKVGLIKVRVYRPFNEDKFLNTLPKTTKIISVLDRTKENTSNGEPLYIDVISTLYKNNRQIKVLGGRYGLGGKDFSPSDVIAIFENMNTKKMNNFTVGITDDLSNLSIKTSKIHKLNLGQFECKFYGIAGDGMVSSNKNTIKIIGDHTDFFSSGFFEYDSKKNSGITISHIRFSDKKILSNYNIDNADFVSVGKEIYLSKYDILKDIKQGGTLLINTKYKTSEELEALLTPNQMSEISSKKIKIFTIDANNLDGESNIILQAAFFSLTRFLDFNVAIKYIKDYAKETYITKDIDIIKKLELSTKDISQNINSVIIPLSWSNQILKDNNSQKISQKGFNLINSVLELKGNNLPTSDFPSDGSFMTDTSKYEKRQIATHCPNWISKKCVQCNICSMVCPHGAIKPILIKEKTAENLPDNFNLIKAKNVKDMNYKIQVNPYDCTGCMVCVNSCPFKALEKVPFNDSIRLEKNNYEISVNIENETDYFSKETIKGSQFRKPYFEFSGACAGCGQTPYIKLITQLFGDRMVIANATGCSSIYSGSAPTTPYSKDKHGRGPAWANSLFEDNAEFGLGIKLAQNSRNSEFESNISNLIENSNSDLANLLKIWISRKSDIDYLKELKKEINLSIVDEANTEFAEYIKENIDLIVPQSTWIIGGDGWAYDIGSSGLDHLLASGENVNILVLDTEVYSNTGGQTSKSSQLGSVSKFSSTGKTTPKKDLGLTAMNYKDVFVSSISMGSNFSQTLKSIIDAEKYDGPSLIIAYSPCITHGIDMSKTQQNMKDAVNCGYYNLYSYDPSKIGTVPFKLSNKNIDPSLLEDYLNSQNRYKQTFKTNPTYAKKLVYNLKENIVKKHQHLLMLDKLLNNSK